MKHSIRKFYRAGLVAILLATLFTFSPLSFRHSAYAQGVRTVAQAQGARIATYEQGARIAVHDQLSGQLLYGRVIIVHLSEQHLYAYENGQEVFDTAVLTGRPSLPTPMGTYRVFAKLSPATFRSPFPRGSVNWYPPTHINYALEFRAGGYYLHDSWWHTVYGAGTNGIHMDPVYGRQNGSHGCVSMPLDAASWLYHWAPLGTVVRIVS